MDLYVRPGADRTKKEEVVREFYRAELRKIIPALIEKWEKKMDKEVEEWQVRQMKTKWGSCKNEDRKIILNLELAKKPPRVLGIYDCA